MCLGSVKALTPEAQRLAKRLGLQLDERSDHLLVYGVDRDILAALRERDEVVVGISPRGVDAELAFASEDLLPLVLSRSECRVLKIPRLHAESGGRIVRAVNEVAIFPRRSASLMSYAVRVDGAALFNDVADGVLISTPLGSSAYARSAGGVLIDPDADVLEIVPVNSTARRSPVIVPASKAVEIAEVRARYTPEIVADGRTRVRLEGGTARVWVGSYARLLKPAPTSRPCPDAKMSPSMRYVYRVLLERGPLTSRSIAEATGLPIRTVEHALRELRRLGLVEAKALGSAKVYSVRP
ncbi:helix-turn-helix domain-containing protein [Thermoproteus tenax]|uniref:HTH arsR-type domain-containing protein n=1 Tax=Thermoproteus tenax (strain ATCC 35583 / DSM 2078 / JCM 9277 / NBRC 100435 / Kra 1) TaxID=768679 RepID=G4RMZ5_THETK|nr:helix-turn-helix domain-containing protein [Thermoproteus tenax]CCC80939.1 hypothetical protein TTX_0263 [Thermoproteus tenax Kra 1]